MAPFHLVYVFQFLFSLFFLNILSQAFIKHSRKAFVYIYIYIVCIKVKVLVAQSSCVRLFVTP